jgi:hypothetical protein
MPTAHRYTLTLSLTGCEILDLQAGLRALVDLLAVDFSQGVLNSPTSRLEFTAKDHCPSEHTANPAYDEEEDPQ